MLFRQLLHEPLSAASYLIGCPAAGVAAVVDPSLSAEQYALLAADRGLRITAVLETHMHADYISNGRALAELTGAQLYLPRRADARFPHQPIDDGWQLQLGEVLLRALHTPGHTPEHVAFVLAQGGRLADPWAVLTGDCLFVGDVGRADLLDLPLSGAAQLYESLQRLRALPETTEVYPTHYGGSPCGGKGMSGKPSSTIGYERRYNPLLGASNLAAFQVLLDETPRSAIDAILHNRNTNRGELPLPARYGEIRAELGAIRAFTLQQASA
ncbi:MAG: MBL fold metallo-hydrolase, partial [Roseiflexaceae bacterium]|nr:MBL fold metallo-hydrolase [Roseiflexaceae bacterium]